MDALPPQSGLTRRAKIIAFVVAWLAAFIATNPSGSHAVFVYMFPMGLAAFFWPPALRGDGWIGMVSCYAAYVIQAIAYFRARGRWSYVWLGVLIILLICNVAGCRDMLDTH